jgi:hypothetical protein
VPAPLRSGPYHLAVLVSELVGRMRAAAEEDPTWLGSERNLALLEKFAAERAPGTVVRWGQSGQRAFASGGVLSIEPPVELAGYDSIFIHAAMAHHEVLHRVYSDDTGAAAMSGRLTLYTPYLTTLGEQVFNWLEDVRMARMEHAAEPANDDYPVEVHRLSVDQQEALYQSSLGEQPWTTSPTHPIAQVRIALAKRILCGELDDLVAPAVARVMAELKPEISIAIASQETNGARGGALAVVAVLAREWDELRRAHAH